MKTRHFWFLGFTAVFAALVGFVFWGTWSLDFAPVMPDCPTTHAADAVVRTFRGVLTSGKFVPDTAKVALGGAYFWQELQYALALYCAALGMAYFCRGRGLSRLASCGAGLLLAFSGYWCTLFSAGHLGWFQWMTYGVFAFGLADRAVRKGKSRSWLLLGACVAWGSFYQTDLWLLFTVLTGAYFVWCCVRERKLPWKGALVAAAVFFLIGAPSIRSAFVNDLASRDRQIEEGQTVAGNAKVDDAEKRWIFTTNWSLPPAETAEFLVPRLNGDTSCPFTLSIGLKNGNGIKPYAGALGRPKDASQGNYRQHSLYVGFITCLLALLGILGFRTKRQAPGTKHQAPGTNSDFAFFAIAAVVCCLFSFGRYCEPVYRCVYALPFGDYLRAPVKWHHLTEFCLCVLAGYGIAWLEGLGVWKVWKVGRFAPWIVGAVVLAGALDLARVDRLYCAPVNVGAARRTNSTMQMTVLTREQFRNPQVSEMVRQGQIVSVANYLGNPDAFVVGVLSKVAPLKPFDRGALDPLVLTLLGLSFLSTLGVVGWSVASLVGRNRRIGNCSAADGRNMV